MENIGFWIITTICVLVGATWVAALAVSIFPKKEYEGEVVTALRDLVKKFILMVSEGTGWKTLGAIIGLVLINTMPDLEDMWRAILSVLDITVFQGLKMMQNKTVITRQSIERITGAQISSANKGIVLPTARDMVDTFVDHINPNNARFLAAEQPSGVVFKPVPDTSVPFNDDDRAEMPQALQDIIAEWFERSITHKPTMPDIPPVSNVLPYQWQAANEQRAEEAGRIIEEEGFYKVFPTKDRDAAYKFRRNCSLKVWNRVNYLWALAGRRWFDYGMALWRFEDSKVNKPPEPRPQPEW